VKGEGKERGAKERESRVKDEGKESERGVERE
jgi:hypothetical protein